MNYFFWGFLLLLVATLIYYIVFFSLIYYWHEKKATVVVVPLIFTFEFFIIGFMVVCIGSILLYYLPDIIKFLPTIFMGIQPLK